MDPNRREDMRGVLRQMAMESGLGVGVSLDVSRPRLWTTNADSECTIGWTPTVPQGGSPNWENTRNAATASAISNILDSANSIKELRARAMYQWGQVRLMAADDPSLKFEPPPESLFLRLAKGLKTGAHPALVALGLSEEAPAAVELEDDYPDKSEPVYIDPEKIWAMQFGIDHSARIILSRDAVSNMPDGRLPFTQADNDCTMMPFHRCTAAATQRLLAPGSALARP